MADVVLRRDVSLLMPTELGALRDAYGKMQSLSDTDNRSWIYWAGQHGFPSWYCWHHGRVGFGDQQPYNLFLPWHRAYLLYMEHTMRDQNADAVFAWWDWTSADSHTIGIPQAFTLAKVNGADNPMYDGPVPAIQGAPARRTIRFPGTPSDLPTAAEVATVLGATDFVDFTLRLEDVHDKIHGWVGGTDPNNPNNGGDMGNVGTAAFDPIFWSHHVTIDRLWYLWQLKNGNDSIPQNYLDKPLTPFSLTVQDVLDARQLGYDYATTQSSSAPGPG